MIVLFDSMSFAALQNNIKLLALILIGLLVEKEVFSGSIKYYQVMDENGNIDSALLPEYVDDSKILEMLKYMVLARELDAKALSLQRQGRAVTYAPLLGEEATQVGAAMALRKDDYFVPNFRQHAVYLVRGLPLELFFTYWRGYEEAQKIPESVRGLPVIVPVSTQMPHAAGIAYAQRYKKTGAAVLAFVGDGGTSEGDFYEAINFAGEWNVPLVTIIENNQWAISEPRKKQSAAETLAQKGIAAGIKRIVQVDGNDVIAVYKAVRESIEAADAGPSVIESLTYRMGLHTTADDPTKYRTEEELDRWRPKDPIARVKRYLVGKGLWSDEEEAKFLEENKEMIDSAIDRAEKFVPDPKSMFENLYSFIPDVLRDEMDEAVKENFWQGDLQ